MKRNHYRHTKQKNRLHRALSIEHKSPLAQSALGGIVGAGIALLITLGSLLFSAMLCYLSEDPLSLTRPVGLILLYLCALIGGILSVRLGKGSPLQCGGFCGLAMLVFFLFLSFFFAHENTALSWVIRFSLPITSVIGGVLGRKRQFRAKGSRR